MILSPAQSTSFSLYSSHSDIQTVLLYQLLSFDRLPPEFWRVKWALSRALCATVLHKSASCCWQLAYLVVRLILYQDSVKQPLRLPVEMHMHMDMISVGYMDTIWNGRYPVSKMWVSLPCHNIVYYPLDTHHRFLLDVWFLTISRLIFRFIPCQFIYESSMRCIQWKEWMSCIPRTVCNP